jgi:hypothetical protein
VEISRKLNLVQPIETTAGRAWVHSMPISREVWETYFLIIAKTYAAILSQQLTVIAGPPIAKMLLKAVAQQLGVWEGPQGVEQGLLAEIRRLSNVVMPKGWASAEDDAEPRATGWDVLPLDEAVRRQAIDDDALAEAEGALVFFTCVSAVLRGPQARGKLTIMLDGLASLWGASTTLSDVMAYAASLPTSTPAASSGAKTPALSVPH